MAKMRTPEEEQATKEALFQVSARVFLRDGYEATSMKTLAEEAGCTTGKFYSNFSGKQEILTMLIQKLLMKNCEEAVRYAKKSGDALLGIAVFYALIYRGSALYENLKEIYCEGLRMPEARLVAEQMVLEILQASMLADKPSTKNQNLLEGTEMQLAFKIATGSIPDILSNINIIAEEEREQAFLSILMRMLATDEETCRDMIKRVQKEDSHIRDKAYDVMVKLLEGKKRRK